MLFADSFVAGSLVGLSSIALTFTAGLGEKTQGEARVDGVTASELSFYVRITGAAPRARREEQKSPLLADAYRETLAAHVTVARVLSRGERESVAVERRIRNAAGLPAANRAELEQNLRGDRERLERVALEATEHRAAVEARLQTIEAMAGRDISEAEIERALLRLGSVREHEPLGLTNGALREAASKSSRN